MPADTTRATDFQFEADALLAWLKNNALPFWDKVGRDAQGGFYEELDLTGAPNPSAVRRVRVQARQIFVYANAHKMGWYNALPMVDQLYDFLLEKGYSPDGKPGFAHRIGADYGVVDAKRDLYDHAFYLLGCASLIDCNDSERAAAAKILSGTLLDFIDLEMGACEGWTEGVPAILPRRQNPHMHLFETSMALFDATQDERHLARAGTIYGLFKDHFFDEDNHVIREFFDNDWTPLKGDMGMTAEPGHACEWVWLLGQYEARTGVNTQRYADALYEKALASNALFLNDEEDVTGAVRRDSKRLWVQTEVIRAHLAQVERGNPAATARAIRTMKAFRTTYLKPDGTWHDQFDDDGKMIASTIPTSTFYHIYGMIVEAMRVGGLLRVNS